MSFHYPATHFLHSPDHRVFASGPPSLIARAPRTVASPRIAGNEYSAALQESRHGR